MMVDAGSSLWRPQGKTKLVLDRAMEHVSSVPYQVSLRWVLYRLLDEGVCRTKADYQRLVALTSHARKNFYDRWAPDTLADETREFFLRGDGFQSPEEWYLAMSEMAGVELDKWFTQRHYIVLMFEAKAMIGQFREYGRGLTLIPLGGDPSIPFKWRVAKQLGAMARKYGKRVLVFYFGDCDSKGLLIGNSAIKDIREWVSAHRPHRGAGGGHGAARESRPARRVPMGELVRCPGVQPDQPNNRPGGLGSLGNVGVPGGGGGEKGA
jgi:hypothetical protein